MTGSRVDNNKPLQRHLSLPLMVSWLLFGIGQGHAATTYQYNIDVPSNLRQFNVELCFSSSPPAYLLLAEDAINNDFRDVYHVTQNKRLSLTPNRRSLVLRGFQQGDCLTYTAAFHDKITYPQFKQRQSTKDQILVSLSQWLWQPPKSQEAITLIDFHLPEGLEVSAPGKRIESSPGRRVYRFRPRPTEWDGRVAIGRFDKVIRNDGVSTIEIAILQGQQKFDHKKILHWVDANLAALRQLYGRVPVEDLQLLIVPTGADREPVPWGQAMRGGGDAIHVYIDQTCTVEEFMDDWVLIHELGHLLHPRINGDGDWLSEGLASYYQNVLRARAGMLTREQAWKKLHAGFERGIKGTPKDLTLAQVTDKMRQNKLFMRVYWSGAAISLIADTRLRMVSDNKLSLDTVLKKFEQCCLPVDKDWTALQLMQKFDELSNTHVFTELYAQYADSTQFPDLSQTYQTLGLNKQGRDLKFQNIASKVNIRQAIMQTTQ